MPPIPQLIRLLSDNELYTHAGYSHNTPPLLHKKGGREREQKKKKETGGQIEGGFGSNKGRQKERERRAFG